jgi:hypothetical protein
MNTPSPRTVSVPHLVFGLVFVGIATIHWIALSTDADLPRTAIGIPIVLIGAGIAGLVAVVVNNRRRSKALSAQYQTVAAEPEAAENPEEQS